MVAWNTIETSPTNFSKATKSGNKKRTKTRCQKIKGVPKKFSMPLKRSESHFELHLWSPFGFHWNILSMGCQCLVFDSKELVFPTIAHATITIETKGEMQVEIQKGHLAYQKTNSLLEWWLWIFSLGLKAFQPNSSS